MTDPTDAGKATYQPADDRTPEKREQELIKSEIAEGRERPADGTRPLSSANSGEKKKEGSLKHIIRTGLPPGIEEEEAEDPGSQYRRRRKIAVELRRASQACRTIAGTMAAVLTAPICCIMPAYSSRRISSTRSTPGWPKAPRPQR